MVWLKKKTGKIGLTLEMWCLRALAFCPYTINFIRNMYMYVYESRTFQFSIRFRSTYPLATNNIETHRRLQGHGYHIFLHFIRSIRLVDRPLMHLKISAESLDLILLTNFHCKYRLLPFGSSIPSICALSLIQSNQTHFKKIHFYYNFLLPPANKTHAWIRIEF